MAKFTSLHMHCAILSWQLKVWFGVLSVGTKMLPVLDLLILVLCLWAAWDLRLGTLLGTNGIQVWVVGCCANNEGIQRLYQTLHMWMLIQALKNELSVSIESLPFTNLNAVFRAPSVFETRLHLIWAQCSPEKKKERESIVWKGTKIIHSRSSVSNS